MNTARKLLLVGLLLSGYLLLPKPAFASTIYLTPASGNIGIGQTLAVQVHLNTGGEAVNGVSAFLAFPADKLDAVYVTAGSAFSVEAEKTIGPGAVKISRGSRTNVTGDVVVATIGFKGKALGSATVSITAGSSVPNAVNSGETINMGGNSGATFTVTQQSSAAAPSQSLPVISGINVTDITGNSAVVSWQTDKKADSTVEYGLDQNNLSLSTNTPAKVTDHKVTLENLSSPPGTKVFLRVKSKVATNEEAVSEITSFQTKGYHVTVTVKSTDGKPLSNIKVTIYTDPLESATNDGGQVSYENVTPGKHVLLLQNGTLEKSLEVEVVDNGNLDQAQEFNVTFDPATSTSPRSSFPLNSKNNLALIVLAVSVLVLIVVAVYLVIKRKRDNGPGPGITDSNPFPLLGSDQPSNPNPVVYHP